MAIASMPTWAFSMECC